MLMIICHHAAEDGAVCCCTGEHTVIVLRALDSLEIQERAGTWLNPFVADFRSRFMALLPGAFRHFAPGLALGLLDPQLQFSEAESAAGIAKGFIPSRGDGSPISAYDMKRLQVRILCSLSARQQSRSSTF